jgi:hypothetical protein
VRDDFDCTCHWCLVPEFYAGGERNFELDHFRPRNRFPEQVNQYFNLYYACHPCNLVKRDTWPTPEIAARGIGFVDLCVDPVSAHFQVLSDGSIVPLTDSARYTIDHLMLNNRHLREIRVLIRRLPGAPIQ